MQNDDISFDSIEGTDDDELDPRTANDDEGSVYSGGDRDNIEPTESADDEQ